MRVFLATLIIALAALAAFGQAPTLRIVSDDGNKLPSELFYGNIKVKPLRLRPGTNVPITINDADFFVSTQYVDFLSRFPDQSGFNFWTNDITVCAADPACTEVKRINVSAAFFVSIEFQQTGYLVYKMYEAGFGTPSNSPVPVRREDFMPDTRTIGNGVVVGQQGWEGVLDANKNAFALAFVQRPAFTAQFPATMTAQEFVNKLDDNVANVLSSSEKSNLVGVLGGSPADPTNRASVLRQLAENSNLSQRDFNRAFVLMQYFGYLKRNPNDAPDTNFDGYNFWLGKLNQFNGNYIQAEMVKAFIASSEYLNRF